MKERMERNAIETKEGTRKKNAKDEAERNAIKTWKRKRMQSTVHTGKEEGNRVEKITFHSRF